jgi:cysteinyl-tRNA synthetase
MNVTDIDPKISARARRFGYTPEKISNKYTLELYSDLSQLRITRINFARVSDYIVMASHLVTRLLEKEMAYTLDGNVHLEFHYLDNYLI